MRTLAFLVVLVACASTVEAQQVAPFRQSVLFQASEASASSDLMPMAAGKTEAVRFAVVGGILGGIAVGGYVYGADQGPDDNKLLYTFGGVALGAGLGYLLGSLIHTE